MAVKKNRRPRNPTAPDKTDKSSDAPLLDATRAAFIQERVSINLAARDAANVPVLTRAFGCRVDPERRRVTLFVSAARAEPLLQCLRANATIAAAFTRPSTHETLQLKGTDAAISPIEKGDKARVAAYRGSFAADLTGIGYSEAFARAVVSSLHDDLVGVTFTPTAAFIATPGPAAGQRLKAGA